MSSRSSRKGSREDIQELLRRNRRQRKARMVAFSILATGALVLITLVIFSLRSCIRERQPANQLAAELPASVEPTASNEAGIRNFSPAPLITAMSADSVLVAIAEKERTESVSATKVAGIKAFGLEGGDARWERPVNDFVSHMLVAGGNAVVFKESGQRLTARAFNLINGEPSWDFSIDGALQVGIASDGRRIAIAYSLEDGSRIAAYDARNGIKSTGKMIPVAGERPMDSNPLNMKFEGNRLLYTLDHTIGMINLDNDKHWTKDSPSQIVTASLDETSSQVYVLSRGQTEGAFVLHVYDMDRGNSRELDRCTTTANSLVMLADSGYLLLAYSDQKIDRHFETTVRVFHQDSGDPYINTRLEGLRVEDAMALSEGMFVLGMNRSTGNMNKPVDGGELYIANPANESVSRMCRLRSEVNYTVRFLEDRLVLLQNGEIHRLDIGKGSTTRVRKAANRYLEPVFSSDYASLAILSYPEEIGSVESHSRQQTIIFH